MIADLISPDRLAWPSARPELSPGYGDGMTSTGLCARPACGRPVAAWLTYDYGGRRVWLDDSRAGNGVAGAPVGPPAAFPGGAVEAWPGGADEEEPGAEGEPIARGEPTARGGDGHRWALCAGHAERLRPPLGWELLDRRGSASALPGAPHDGAYRLDRPEPAGGMGTAPGDGRPPLPVVTG